MEERIEPKRIGIVAYSAPPFSAGGVASAHYNLFKALERSGVDVRLFTFGDNQELDEKNLVRRGTPPWIPKYLRKVNGKVFKLIENGHTAYQTVDILSSLFGSWKMGKAISKFNPHVVILSDHGAPGLVVSKGRNTKWVLVSHHNPARFVGEPYFSEYSKKDAAWAVLLENRVLTKVDTVVCPSSYMKSQFVKTYAYTGGIRIIPNLVDELIYTIVPNTNLYISIGMREKFPIIYMPSIGSQLKGREYALQIIRDLASSYSGELGFYLPGIIESGFIEQTKNLPSSVHLYLPGQVEYLNHIANVKACSFGISPSLLENYSMAILEAVCSGVPVLAFKTGGNEEIVNDGNNGFLVNDGDISSLSVLGLKLLKEGNLAAFKNKTLEYSQNHLSNKQPLGKYLDLIESI